MIFKECHRSLVNKTFNTINLHWTKKNQIKHTLQTKDNLVKFTSQNKLQHQFFLICVKLIKRNL